MLPAHLLVSLLIDPNVTNIHKNISNDIDNIVIL